MNMFQSLLCQACLSITSTQQFQHLICFFTQIYLYNLYSNVSLTNVKGIV